MCCCFSQCIGVYHSPSCSRLAWFNSSPLHVLWSGSLITPLSVGLRPLLSPVDSLEVSGRDSSLPTPSQPGSHIHPHILSPSVTDFFTHLRKQTLKSTRTGMPKLSIQQSRTHSYSHISLVSRAPESLHSSLSVLQRVLHFVHQAPERRERKR